MLTGQRPGEIYGLRWDRIDGDLLTIPGGERKNGLPQMVPLSGPAKALLDALPSREGFLFSYSLGDTPVNSHSAAMTKLHKQVGPLLGGKWGPTTYAGPARPISQHWATRRRFWTRS